MDGPSRVCGSGFFVAHPGLPFLVPLLFVLDLDG
jgi:hypothetical protein